MTQKKRIPSKNHKSRQTCTILFTCIGRRVSLLKAFQRAARQLGINAVFIGTDVQLASPAMQLCDEQFLVHPTSHRLYVSDIKSIIKEQGVDLLVPTVDLDLKTWAKQRTAMTRLGCHILISSERVIDLCQDKRKTYQFLQKQGIDAPETVTLQEQLDTDTLAYPCYVKPWDGYAGKYNTCAESRSDLFYLQHKVPHALCQAYIRGKEYTCDVYVDFNGQVQCVVPRQRLEVRAGEVSKARVVMDQDVIQAAAQVVTCLKAGPGVITVQLMKTEAGDIKVIEINPRFGGGVPLAIKAGANFPKWILQELTGDRPNFSRTRIQDDLVMLRYDHEIWSTGSDLALEGQAE